jgi:hypothetical protein
MNKIDREKSKQQKQNRKIEAQERATPCNRFQL